MTDAQMRVAAARFITKRPDVARVFREYPDITEQELARRFPNLEGDLNVFLNNEGFVTEASVNDQHVYLADARHQAHVHVPSPTIQDFNDRLRAARKK